MVLRLGLPLAVLFAAMNPIWGFTWYFNTESWASAFYQKMTELRVDTWRAAMVDADHGRPIAATDDDLFRVTPPGSRTATSASSSSAIPARATHRNTRWSIAISISGGGTT